MEERRLKRINSWKEEVAGELSEETIQSFEQYFAKHQQYNRQHTSPSISMNDHGQDYNDDDDNYNDDETYGRRSRHGSIDSTGSSYDDVYEIHDENDLSFSDDEVNEREGSLSPRVNDIVTEDSVQFPTETHEEGHTKQLVERSEKRATQKQQLSTHNVLNDSLSYHPYTNSESLRGGGRRLVYSLTSVIHHLGSGMGGHYICFRRVQSATGDRWFMMNDSRVKEVPWSTVHQNSIYMVEYELEERNCSCFFGNKQPFHNLHTYNLAKPRKPIKSYYPA